MATRDKDKGTDYGVRRGDKDDYGPWRGGGKKKPPTKKPAAKKATAKKAAAKPSKKSSKKSSK